MELKNLIAMPWEYNFEFECGDKEYVKLDTFERYFTYKVLGERADSAYKLANEFIEAQNDKFKTIIYDPDGSGRHHYDVIHEIYGVLWKWKKVDKTTFGIIDTDNGLYFGCDTMNSVQTVLGWLVGANHSGKYSMRWSLKCWRENPQKFDDYGIKDYIDAYHTLGNFVLVPAGFNRDRGIDTEINDFWDRSLKYLKDEKYTTEGYGNFPEEDKTFEWYINYFFLWDWVKKEGKEYYVEISSPNKPDKGECLQNAKDFFDENVKRIQDRGKFMTAMLMIQQEDSKLYDNIREKFFCTNKTYNNFKYVKKEVLLYVGKENKSIKDKLIERGLLEEQEVTD